jgi:hypothetical protein
MGSSGARTVRQTDGHAVLSVRYKHLRHSVISSLLQLPVNNGTLRAANVRRTLFCGAGNSLSNSPFKSPPS